ncbi:IS1595 family transposase [Cohnella pontilimi]|uniref:IS1595 family transposase n=1 Tax=Cohnella pontilimi TaxID=2564100 RepID=A0A4U0FF13_9BACL|nr:transposase [Cohnella pontilimi]TJY43546.1 IS1595 family transposase [Cohnella pontilimi]
MEIGSFEDVCMMYGKEKNCIQALFTLKWPEGYRCPRCGCSQASTIQSRRLPLYECVSCWHQTSIIAGTVMQGSRTPLSKWFQALYLHTRPSAISATQLSEMIGVTYKTAWLMGQKIRNAFSRADEKEQLSGLIRLTPSLYGRMCLSSSYRETHEHPLLIGASLNENAQITQIKIKQVAESEIVGKTVNKIGKNNFVRNHVQMDVSEVVSDVGRARFEHSTSLKRLGRAAGSWLNTVFHGIGPKHLQSYLDQFSFQINQTVRKMSVFQASLSWCAVTTTVTYSEIINRPSRIPAQYVPQRHKKSALQKAG